MPLSLPQRRLVLIAWITYAAFYLCRVNFATALPAMQADLGLSKGQIGVITGGFLWMYAIGQLINGWLGDRVNPQRLMAAGMMATALLNLIFAWSSAYLVLVLLWGLNGYLQATGWPPLMRVLANWLSPTQRTGISSIFSSCFMFGHAFTWFFTGWLIVVFGWRSAFWIPALVTLLFAIHWLLRVQATPHHEEQTTHRDQESAPHNETTPATINNQQSKIKNQKSTIAQIWPLLVGAFAHGFAQLALGTWLPTYYVEEGQVSIGVAASLSALMPFTGVIGSLIGAWVLTRLGHKGEALGLVILLLIVAASFLLLPVLPNRLWVAVSLLVLVGIAASGATGIFLTTMPLVLSGDKGAASMTGLINFCFNFGAGISTGVTGLLLDVSGWGAVFLLFGGVTLVAALFLGMMHWRVNSSDNNRPSLR